MSVLGKKVTLLRRYSTVLQFLFIKVDTINLVDRFAKNLRGKGFDWKIYFRGIFFKNEKQKPFLRNFFNVFVGNTFATDWSCFWSFFWRVIFFIDNCRLASWMTNHGFWKGAAAGGALAYGYKKYKNHQCESIIKKKDCLNPSANCMWDSIESKCHAK
jgi:hypothetical protein